MKKLLFISLAALLALSMVLIGCGEAGVEYTLTIASSEGGSVSPAVGNHTYTAGKVVNLVATPATYYGFANWTGDTSAIANVTAATTTITMNATYSIQANFVLVEPWDFTIALDFHCTGGVMSSIWLKVYQPWIWAVGNATGPDGGNFTFAVTFSGIYSPEDSLTALGAGVADLGQLSGDTFHTAGIGYIPFMFNMTSGAYASYKLFREEVDTWDTLGELDDVVILLSTPLQPAQWIGTVNCTMPADFPGKLVRAEAGEVPTIQTALGATPRTVATGDLATALGSGYVQGCFFTYSGMLSFGLADVAAVNYSTEVNLFPRFYFLAMNKEVYNDLHPDARAKLDTFCTAQKSVYYANQHLLAQAGKKAGVNGKLVAKGGGIYVPSAGELDTWKTATAGVKPYWINYLNGLGFNGTGLVARAEELIPLTPAP